MDKLLIFIILSFILILPASAKPNFTLKFSRNGQFKIVQFTDTHIDLIKGANLEVYETIRKVLENEKPDLVMLTGDVVTQDDPQQAYLKLSEIFSAFNTPWAMVFGNHDSEHNFTRKQLAEFLQSLPLCMNDDKGMIQGNSNFTLAVMGKNKSAAAVLYCMDSNTYSTLKPAVDGYGWFNTSQIDWYRNNCYSFSAGNSGKPLPALAFFHIPLPEYTKAWNNKTGKVFGVKNEDECSPELNTGMFAAMVMGGDVMGTFVGHDHINDYIGILNNIALAYGRVTKKMKDAADPLAGGRVIVLKEGKREFDTWIREASGTKVLECSYPGSFVLKK
jgi:predicted phosphodiesterase